MVRNKTYDCRSRNRVVREIRVDIHHVPRLSARNETRNADQRPWRAGATIRDSDLRALNIKLGNARWVRVMDAELLDTEEVVAAGKVLGDVVRICLCVWVRCYGLDGSEEGGLTLKIPHRGTAREIGAYV